MPQGSDEAFFNFMADAQSSFATFVEKVAQSDLFTDLGAIEEGDQVAQSDIVTDLGAMGESDDAAMDAPFTVDHWPSEALPADGVLHKTDYTATQIAEMRAEGQVAFQMGLRRQQRGPPGPGSGGPTLWRSTGQTPANG